MSFYYIGDEIALGQDKAHSFMSLGHAVAWRGHIELEWQSARGMDSFLDVLGQRVQVHVAGIKLGEGIGDSYEGFDRGFIDVHASTLENGSSNNTDWEIAFVENCLAFGFLHFDLLKMVLEMESAGEQPC